MKNARSAILLLVFLASILVWTLPAQIALSDESDAAFTIANPVVTVLSPNGGEIWNAGESHAITWNLVETVASVSIDYSAGAIFPVENAHYWR